MARPTDTVLRLRFPEGSWEPDEVVVEEPLEVRVEGTALTVTMRTPGHDVELALGLLVGEGLIDGPDDVVAVGKVRSPLDPHDNTVEVRLAGGLGAGLERLASRRTLFATSACGVCGTAGLDRLLAEASPLRRTWEPDLEVLVGLPEVMRRTQGTFSRTGGLHAAALFTPAGRLEVLREDVGRHNAVDKVVGWRLLQDALPVDDRVLVVSGRVGWEILQKAVAAQVPVVASVGAPTSLAVELASRSGVTLAGFVRDGRLNVYSPKPSR